MYCLFLIGECCVDAVLHILDRLTVFLIQRCRGRFGAFDYVVVVGICHWLSAAFNCVDQSGQHEHMRAAVDCVDFFQYQPAGKRTLYAGHIVNYIVAEAVVFIGVP